MKLVEKDGPGGRVVTLEIRAKPRAKKSRIEGARGDALEVSLAAPPVDGAANEELVRTLAEALGLRQRDIVLVRGETARTKLVEIRGLTSDEIRARLVP